MATNDNHGNTLTGPAAALASLPLAATPQGGVEFGFRGESNDGKAGTQPDTSPFDGLGGWMEDDDAKVFKRANELVLRQELLARNHLAQDTHWTYVKRGYPWSVLEKVPNQDIYRTRLPYGAKAISTQAVPNKAWDLINKAAETLLVDFPDYDPQPLTSSEEAQEAATMAQRALSQDASEDGTNDQAIFYQALDKALTCASSYIELWVDPSGDGRVPLQIKAHPQAESPDNPLVGPDGMPTTDYVLRYVTADNQFTENPAEAAPQWMPKMRATVWGREHIRVFPETEPINKAEKVIGLFYCTLSEAKRRWESVAQMTPDQLSELCSWTPPRYLPLLPPFERARWRMETGNEQEKSGSSDERLMFYYAVYQRSVPEHPKGAQVVVTGAKGGLVLERKPLWADVELTTAPGDQPQIEPRALDLPIVQLTPRVDADDRDPSGTAFIELFGGATEFAATLQMAYLEAIDQILHIEKYIPSTSPVEGWQVAEARASGNAITVLTRDDFPQYGETPPLPNDLLNVLQYGVNQQDSIASLNKPIQGDNSQQEVSGKSRDIAIQQARVGLNRMQKATNSAVERYGRIKLQLMMRDFTVPMQIRYVGDDGAYLQAQWTATNFALVGDVRIKSGTGTMMTPEGKVNYLGALKNLGLIGPEEAAEAARPAFASSLGMPDNSHEQYIERCVTSWQQGPPEGWAELFQQHQQAMAQYQAATLPMVQQHAEQDALGQAQGGPPLPPPQMPPPPPAPWSPFQDRPNDAEPEIAALWKRRLSKVMSTVKYAEMDPAWRSTLDEKYQKASSVVQHALQAAMPQPQGPRPGHAPDRGPPAPPPHAGA